MGDIKINANGGPHVDEDGARTVMFRLHRNTPALDLECHGPWDDYDDLKAAAAPGEDWESQAASTWGTPYTSLPTSYRVLIRAVWALL